LAATGFFARNALNWLPRATLVKLARFQPLAIAPRYRCAGGSHSGREF